MPIRTDVFRLPLTSLLLVSLVLLPFASLSLRAQSAKTDPLGAAALATQGDASHGVPACSSCHGDDGQGNPSAGFPKLAGLPANYLLLQLQGFASGQRSNPIMMPVAKTLSTREMHEIADYYAAMPAPPTPAAQYAPDLLSEGAALAQHGRVAQGLPACELCHGRGGVGVSPTFPPLAGQSATYMINQLQAWQQKTRPPGPMGLMSGVASKLSSRDMQSVAAYFSTLAARPDRGTP